MKNVYKIISLVIVVTGLYFLFRSNEVIQPPGILAPDEPIQNKLTNKTAWIIDGFQFTPVRSFDATVRVLSIKFYGTDDMSDFCPADLAIGWNKMSDQSVIDNLSIKQQHRWYVWRTDRMPITRNEIELSSSNVHIIPETDIVEDRLDDIVRGNIIRLSGQLVNVNKLGEKFTWKTSIKRDDTGGGACEILWTESIDILK